MKTVLVTGGGRGIGRAIAHGLAGPDTLVIVAARTRTQVEQVVSEIEEKGGQALAVTVDVGEEASVRGAAREISESSSRVDVLVNNAGLGGGEEVEGSDTSGWREIVNTNIVGTYLVSRAIIPMMGEGGRIINNSSVLGRFGVPGYTAYCASKHGVIVFTRALALELAPKKITVNAVCPGWVDTEMAAEGMRVGAAAMGTTFDEFRRQALGRVPIDRIIQPEEVATLVRFLASDETSALTGQTYNICGGQTMD